MSEDDTPPSGADTRNAVVAWLAACLLIGSFGYRLLTAAHEYPMRTEQVMTMAFDALLVVGLFATGAKLSRPLFWIALVCGIGLFAIRLNSDASWWTGHRVYSVG